MTQGNEEKKFPIWEILSAVAAILGVISSIFFYFDAKQSTENKIVEALAERYESVDQEMSYEQALEAVDKNLEILKNAYSELQNQNDDLQKENQRLREENIQLQLGNSKVQVSGTDTSPVSSAIVQPPIDNDTGTLKISINPAIQMHENYYYEYPDPNNPSSNFVINLGKGISGTFSYSRKLTEEERADWSHGGRLYDNNGNEIGQEGNWPSFWSEPDGKFAVEFPQSLPSGHYTYELYQIISGQYVSDQVSFEIP